MHEILNALLKALRSLFHPKMLALVLWPVVLAAVLWGGLAFFFWPDWVAGLQGLIDHAAVHDFLGRHELAWMARAAATMLAFLVLVPLGVVTALLIAAVVAMPYMVRFIAERDYPGLEMKRGGTVLGSIWNGLAGVVVFVVLWLLALPLWLSGPFALAVPSFSLLTSTSACSATMRLPTMPLAKSTSRSWRGREAGCTSWADCSDWCSSCPSSICFYRSISAWRISISAWLSCRHCGQALQQN